MCTKSLYGPFILSGPYYHIFRCVSQKLSDYVALGIHILMHYNGARIIKEMLLKKKLFIFDVENVFAPGAGAALPVSSATT